MTRHRLDLLSLVSGLVLGGVGLAALVDVELAELRWDLLAPAALLVAGGAVLLSALRRRRRDAGAD